jgi:hypothetical protein
MGSIESWQRVWGALTRQRRVTAMDRRGPGSIRAGGERLQAQWDFFVQITHPGTIALDGDTATGRAYIQELARARDGRQGLNLPSTTTATGAPATAGSSPSGSTRSGTSTPLRWRARRPARPGRPLTRRPGTRPRRKELWADTQCHRHRAADRAAAALTAHGFTVEIPRRRLLRGCVRCCPWAGSGGRGRG